MHRDANKNFNRKQQIRAYYQNRDIVISTCKVSIIRNWERIKVDKDTRLVSKSSRPAVGARRSTR